MKRSVISRIFVLFAVMAMTAIPSLSFAADSTMLSNPAILNKNLQKGSGGGVPVGTVIAWPAASNPADPENWLECNGQAISQAAYPELFAVVGATVPDYQGMFLRGYGSQTHVQNNGSTVGNTATTHASGALRVVQGDAVRNITGSNEPVTGIGESAGGALLIPGAPVRFWGSSGGMTRLSWGPLIFDASRVVPTAAENRPANMAVRYLIRAVE